MAPKKLYPRYRARRVPLAESFPGPLLESDETEVWEVFDTLRGAPYMSANGRADAIRGARLANEGTPKIPRGYKVPVRLTVKDMTHYKGVARKLIKDNDKYQLANVLAERIEYASDRLCPEHIYLIQLLWDAVQRANGFAPYRG
jgi:hypothetical protein